MSEFQKSIIEKFLKEKKKSKRELASFLNIKENSVNRTLKNPNISFGKLGKIAEFLEVDIRDFFPIDNSFNIQNPKEEYVLNPGEANGHTIIANLSDVLKTSSRTIEIMAETENANAKNIENLMKILAEKLVSDNPGKKGY
jgi:DNA-binding Xre family transcriptional regulator